MKNIYLGIILAYLCLGSVHGEHTANQPFDLAIVATHRDTSTNSTQYLIDVKVINRSQDFLVINTLAIGKMKQTYLRQGMVIGHGETTIIAKAMGTTIDVDGKAHAMSPDSEMPECYAGVIKKDAVDMYLGLNLDPPVIAPGSSYLIEGVSLTSDPFLYFNEDDKCDTVVIESSFIFSKPKNKSPDTTIWEGEITLISLIENKPKVTETNTTSQK